MLRIGIWFDARHCAYGGPTLVLIGTILGLYKDAARRNKPITLLFNEPGDVNWAVDATENLEYTTQKAPNILVGPACFGTSDVAVKNENLENHQVWKYTKHGIVPSVWFGKFISHGLPYLDPKRANGRRLHIWGAGVDVDRFCPDPYPQKTQDYFIYFKSQRYEDLRSINSYLFNNYFQFRGTTLTYYFYSPEMLLEAARKSRFCIMLDRTETQGLASLEIMACNCPLFVLDWTEHTYENKEQVYNYGGASSVPCMDHRCGMKSSWKTLEQDFPAFLKQLPTYTPRDYVLESYSFEASARKLRTLMDTVNHAETS
jgi:hypothetical protein